MSDEETIDVDEVFNLELTYDEVEALTSALMFTHIRLGDTEVPEAEVVRVRLLLLQQNILEQVKAQATSLE